MRPDFAGGASPIDPNITLPAGGRYRDFSQVDQPYTRYTNLTSLDLSYNLGFATLSSTSSYYTTAGSVLEDNTDPWLADHCINPDDVPGVLLSNRALRAADPALKDLTVTILGLFGAAPGAGMSGRSVF